MCDTRLKGHSDWSPFEQRNKGEDVSGGGVPVAEEKMVPVAEQKKGFIARLFGQKPKGGGCCSVRIEEISEEEDEEAPQQVRPLGRDSSSRGPAPTTGTDS